VFVVGRFVELDAGTARITPQRFATRLEGLNKARKIFLLPFPGLLLAFELKMPAVDVCDHIGDLYERRVVRLDREGAIDDLIKPFVIRDCIPDCFATFLAASLIDRIKPLLAFMERVGEVRHFPFVIVAD